MPNHTRDLKSASRPGRVTGLGLALSLAAAVGAVSISAWADLPPVPQPAENPITESKRVLGKILFFDEQLSTSSTVSCATCHVNSRGGTDPRIARHPGPDGILNTPDDKLGSPGVIRSDAQNNYIRDAIFALNPQVTDRTANSPVNAAFFPELFWDGRARGQFVDPQTGLVAIAAGGALESQCVNPPVSSVEMAHEQLDWGAISAKLARVQPLDLATGLPPDVAAAVTGRPGYPELFRRAFGDTQITSKRVAFAIATYQRTLIANDTPWDRSQAGQPGGLSPGQQAGLQTFQQNCVACHTPPLFSDTTFRNIGLRPVVEDTGRQGVTGLFGDRGKFKVPSLRNVGLHNRFMHNGQFTTVQDVVRFYARAPGAPQQFPDNRDPAMNAIQFPPQAEPALVDFLVNGLRDARVANQTFPFDRPVLFTERPADQATLIGGGVAGSGGIVPRIIVQGPPMVGNVDYRTGLDGALGGAGARLAFSTSPPVGGRITPERIVGVVGAGGAGAGQGLATLHWPLNPGDVVAGQIVFLQWIVTDAAAPGGEALSAVARLPIFCGSSGCPAPCGYANCDGSTVPPVLNVSDFLCFLTKYSAGDSYANCDGSTAPPVLNVSDFTCFLNKYSAGCP